MEPKIGDHFWALLDNHLVIMAYEHADEGYYLCGSWEIAVKRSEFQVIEIISKPKGYENVEYYFQRPL